MSSVTNIIKAFNDLSYEPVLDGEATIKSWIATQNEGVFTAQIQNCYLPSSDKQSSFNVKNPANGHVLAKVVNADKKAVDLAIEACRNALGPWRALSHIERGRIIYNVARNIQKHLSILTACESLFSGRSSREVKDLDVANLIKIFYYYAGQVGLHNSESSDFDSMVPLGVVAIAGYFDSPLLSVATKLAAALATGNTCLLVPHQLTPLSTYMLVNILYQSGLPSGVVNLCVSDNDEIYKQISRDPKVDCVCYDGKVQIGQELIISQSFINPNKRNLLSLEGKSSLVIYEAADVDSAIEAIVDGCFYANGQHRYSLNKVLIQEPLVAEAVSKLEARFEKLRFGNHMDKCNDYGPFIRQEDLKAFKDALNTQAKDYGAEIKQFGESGKQAQETPAAGPIIVKNVGMSIPLNLNEVNGPYVMIIPFRTVKESVELLNTSKYGSSVSLFSQNISLVMEVAYLVNAGTVWINSFNIERGVQTRKMSGNYKTLGLESLKNFLKPKWDQHINVSEELKGTSVEEFFKQLKNFGSANPAPTLPSGQTLKEEKTYKLYIGGKQTRPDTQSSRAVNLQNKDEVYCLVADASRKDVRNAVEAAVAAFNPWWKRANHNKSQILYYFGENFDSRATQFVDKLELLTKKPRSQCELEVKTCSNIIYYFASICDKIIGKLNDTTEYGFSCEVNEPIGCIAVICGHNSANSNPLLSFVVHMLGAIAYGNTVIMVPDEKTPVPALDLYEIFDTSDMPGGVVNILTGNKQHLTKYLCEHQQINAIWYISDDATQKELVAQQFIKYTCNYNLKQCWLISSNLPTDEKFLCKNYLNEICSHAIQSKFIQIPMGTIFAN